MAVRRRSCPTPLRKGLGAAGAGSAGVRSGRLDMGCSAWRPGRPVMRHYGAEGRCGGCDRRVRGFGAARSAEASAYRAVRRARSGERRRLRWQSACSCAERSARPGRRAAVATLGRGWPGVAGTGAALLFGAAAPRPRAALILLRYSRGVSLSASMICAAATDDCWWGVGRRSLRDAISRRSVDFI